VLDDSPTKRIGGDILKGFKKYTHKKRLYSLDKCQTAEELKKWTEKIKTTYPDAFFTVEYKLDGLSVNLLYTDGVLKTAATRGNGSVGEDVTAQIMTIKSVPLKIPFNRTCEIQGEVIMRKSSLKKYNEKNPDTPLKNERNAAAGAVRNLDPKVTASRKLDVITYAVGYIEDGDFDTQSGLVEFLKSNGFRTAEYFKKTDNLEYLIDYIGEIEKERGDLDYLIDGVVIKVDDLNIREELGYTEKFPRFAIAYKFEATEASTIIKDVIWQVSRTGKLNPLAILEPVEIGGTTVSRATLSNMSEIRRKDIKINSKVFVRRSNDVIPEITGIAEHYADSVDVIPPAVCPSCGSHLKCDAVFIYCTNPENCRDITVSKITHYASREAMDIVGLSEKTVEVFYDKLNVREVQDIYKLTVEELTALEGFRDKKAENIINSIEISKNAEITDFVYALGIENVGKKAAKELASNFGSFESIKNSSVEEIEQIRDFGAVTAKCVYDFFRNEKNLKTIEEIFSSGVKLMIPEKKEEKTGIFTGKTVVLTGVLKNYKRSEAQSIIAANGGDVADTISKKVSLVIAGADAGGKLEKAKKLKIEIIGEDEFISLINRRFMT
ncbi:MAG: NAD-dependent DNA ligase LigA, partial [Clostridiales bacterium]|nr:NAD-dependent DNA ligase LigA [Clostridiales bacterium]